MAKTNSQKPYHHGDLRNALLNEAERIVEAEGISGLTLRAVARGAGVSHTAPSTHFGDLAGLLSELAAHGHLRMDAELQGRAEAAGDDLAERARAMGRGYIDFAQAHPGLFTLMYRSEKLDPGNASLKVALEKKRELLRSLLMRRSGAEDAPPERIAAQAMALWSLVHGYATLILDGRLSRTIDALPGKQTPETFFDLMIDAVRIS